MLELPLEISIYLLDKVKRSPPREISEYHLPKQKQSAMLREIFLSMFQVHILVEVIMLKGSGTRSGSRSVLNGIQERIYFAQVSKAIGVLNQDN
jgi:hypothetical protein